MILANPKAKNMFRFNLTQRKLKCLVKIDSTPSINDIKMILKRFKALSFRHHPKCLQEHQYHSQNELS